MDRITQLENELYKEYAESNHHTEAVMVEAIQARRFDLLGLLAAIADRQSQQGYITKEDQHTRDRISEAIKGDIDLYPYFGNGGTL